MAKFKIGDKVVRVDGEGGWDEEIRVGHCYAVLNEEIGYINVLSSYPGRNEPGWLMDVRFELYEEEKEMNVEQLRDEVVRIDKRIEEANKDIENAQKERKALVEKIREKGFILLDSENPTPIGNGRPTEGDTVRVIRVDEDYDSTIYLGYQFVIQEDDASGLPYEDEFGNWFREDSVVKI